MKDEVVACRPDRGATDIEEESLGGDRNSQKGKHDCPIKN
jgi:hypothetical protein